MAEETVSKSIPNKRSRTALFSHSLAEKNVTKVLISISF